MKLFLWRWSFNQSSIIFPSAWTSQERIVKHFVAIEYTLRTEFSLQNHQNSEGSKLLYCMMMVVWGDWSRIYTEIERFWRNKSKKLFVCLMRSIQNVWITTTINRAQSTGIGLQNEYIHSSGEWKYDIKTGFEIWKFCMFWLFSPFKSE